MGFASKLRCSRNSLNIFNYSCNPASGTAFAEGPFYFVITGVCKMNLRSGLFRGSFAVLAVAASQACMASAVTLNYLPAGAGISNVTGDAATAAPGFGSGSWASPGTGGKSELYVTASSLFSSPVKISDIASVSYWTNKGGASTAVDWTFYMYTAQQGAGDTGSFYRSRLNAEPYFTNTAAIAANTWHQWSTGSSADSLRFYDQARSGTLGTYTDPMLAALESGPVTWGNNTTWNYADEVVSLFSLQTGSAWANGFTGLVDGLTITLKNGDVGIVNLEANALAAVPEPTALALVGTALFAAAAARRRRAAPAPAAA